MSLRQYHKNILGITQKSDADQGSFLFAWYIHTCMILHGKLKEAATEYKSHVHHGGTRDPVVSCGTTRFLSNSPAHSHSTQTNQINYDTSHGTSMICRQYMMHSRLGYRQYILQSGRRKYMGFMIYITVLVHRLCPQTRLSTVHY